MDKAILLIDRGSREYEVKKELEELCSMIMNSSDYLAGYSFLEIAKPSIYEGILSYRDKDLTIVPYFLYPGLKLKMSILESERIARELNIKCKISEPLYYHPNLAKIVKNRINEAKVSNKITLDDKECDVLLIAHGSRDIDAKLAFESIYEEVRDSYRNTNYAFLELDKPTIQEGLSKSLSNNPKVLIIMPYFLHYGTHMKYDLIREINEVTNGKDERVIMSKHLGVSKEMVEIILEKVRQA